METFDTTRGIGRELELFGIKSSAILVLAAGIAIGILLYFLLSISGTSTLAAIFVAIIWCTIFSIGVLVTNRRLGKNGLTKFFARRGIPRGIRNGSRCYNLIRRNAKKKSRYKGNDALHELGRWSPYDKGWRYLSNT